MLKVTAPEAVSRTRNGSRQPLALWVMGATEFWDRVSFHGMQALLVLYLVDHLLQPRHAQNVLGLSRLRASVEGLTGPLTDRGFAVQIFGIYIALLSLAPLAGGFIGDRWMGRRFAVLYGALAMTAGHACVAFDRTFLLAIVLLVVGAGLLRGNLLAQLAELYPAHDARRDEGFQIYFALINAGMFLAPLATGYLARRYGYQVGLASAGAGMAIGFGTYACGLKVLPQGTNCITERQHSPGRWRWTLWSLGLFVPVASLFWIAQAQVWNTYNLWARDHVDLVLRGFLIPVPWLQAFDSLCVISLSPFILWQWRRQAAGGTEPPQLRKLIIGCLLFGSAMSLLGVTSAYLGAGKLIPLAWVLLFHGLSNIGYCYFAPTAVAFVSRLAPPDRVGVTVGLYLISSFLGGLISGRLGALYGTVTPATFWCIHGGLVLGAAVLLRMEEPLLERLSGRVLRERQVLA